MSKNLIKRLIEEEFKRRLFEQQKDVETDTTSTDTDTSSDTGDLDLSSGDAGDNSTEGVLDLGGDSSTSGDDGLSQGGSTAGGELGDNITGEDGDLGDDSGFSGGSGGGFSGRSGGGGFDFGGAGGEAGLEPDEEEEENLVSTVGPEDVEIPTDPVLSITNDAIELLNQTKEPAKILKNIKSSMQKYFDDFDDATPIIKSLWDTESVVLRDVARRLLLFIKGI